MVVGDGRVAGRGTNAVLGRLEVHAGLGVASLGHVDGETGRLVNGRLCASEKGSASLVTSFVRG